MSDLPQISEAEFEVMKIVWKHAPIITDYKLESENDTDFNQTPRDQRRSDL